MGVFEVNSLKTELKKCQEVVSDIVWYIFLHKKLKLVFILFFILFSSFGPPNATILCSLERETIFPSELCHFVFEKLEELSIAILATK